jgi:hypothetical protein
VDHNGIFQPSWGWRVVTVHKWFMQRCGFQLQQIAIPLNRTSVAYLQAFEDWTEKMQNPPRVSTTRGS